MKNSSRLNYYRSGEMSKHNAAALAASAGRCSTTTTTTSGTCVTIDLV